jgi:pilus assembly protein CpaB
MSLKKLLLLGIALAAGLGTVYMAQAILQPPPPPPAAPAPKKVAAPEPKPQLRVLVSARSLPAGHLIVPDDLVWTPWDETDARLHSYYLEGEQPLAELHGAVVRRGIEGGQPLLQGRIVKPGEQGFLAAVLEPGMRAVAVRINLVTGIAGLVFPGDRVDLLLTQRVERPNDPQRPERFASETVLTNLRVLAIDQSTNDQTSTPKQAETVTLEVTPKQAELVTLMSEIGQLSLSLRSLQGEEEKQLLAQLLPGRAEPTGAEVELHQALGYGIVAGQSGGATAAFAGSLGRGVSGSLGAARGALRSANGASGGGGEAHYPEVELSPELEATLAGLTPAERAAALRSLNAKPYSWDSDVSLLLPEPSSASQKSAPVRTVHVVRGSEAAVIPFKR